MDAPRHAPTPDTLGITVHQASTIFIIACLTVVAALGAWLYERMSSPHASYVDRAYQHAMSSEIQGDFLAAGYRIVAKKGFYDVSIVATCDRAAELKSVPCGEIPNVPFKVSLVATKQAAGKKREAVWF